MGCLPDELWTKILGLGIEKEVLDYRDLCSLAFVCRRIKQISYFDRMWRSLWERDQVKLSVGSSSRNLVVEPGMARKENDAKAFRDLYRIRFEEVRAAKRTAKRRNVLRVYVETICRTCNETLRGLRVMKDCFQIAQAGSRKIFGDVLHSHVP